MSESGRKIWGEILICVIYTGFLTAYMDSTPWNHLGHFDCGGVTHQLCDFNKFLQDFREIRPEKPTEKAFKKSHERQLD